MKEACAFSCLVRVNILYTCFSIFSDKRTTNWATRHLLRFLALFYFSRLHLASTPFLCFFVPQFHAFCSNFILKSIGQATTMLACRPGMSHHRASVASTRVELPHLLRSFISWLILNFNFKNRSFLLTSFQTYEVTWASYVDSTLHTKNPN